MQEAIGQEDQPCLEPHLLDDEEEGVEEAPLDLADRRGTSSESPSADEAPRQDRTGSAPASAPQKSHSEQLS